MKWIIKIVDLICEKLSHSKIKMISKPFGFLHSNKAIISYLIVGGFTTVVSILSYALFRLFITNYIICTILSWIAAVLFAYVNNRILVFESKNKQIGLEFIKFVLCRIVTLLSEVAVMFILVDLLNINDMVSKILVQFIIIVLNYILSKIFVFK